MKLFGKLRTWIFAAAAVFMLAAPAYSWTYYDNFAPARGYYHQGGYGDHAYSRPYRAHRRVIVDGPWYVQRGYAPAMRSVIPFGFSVPGFSFFVGP